MTGPKIIPGEQGGIALEKTEISIRHPCEGERRKYQETNIVGKKTQAFGGEGFIKKKGAKGKHGGGNPP